MKPRPALQCLCLLALAAPAFAQTQIPGQLYLNFDDCAAGPRDKVLDCTNTTSRTTIVATLKPGGTIDGVVSDLALMEVVVGSDPLTMPPFWQFSPNGCAGQANIAFSADFTTYSLCTDVWSGAGQSGGLWDNSFYPYLGDRALVKWTTHVADPAQAFSIPGGTQAYIERITLRQNQLPSCAGCNSAVCMVYEREQLNQQSGSYFEIDGGAAGTEWLSINDPANTKNCPAPTPTRASTWGQVKSLYR